MQTAAKEALSLWHSKVGFKEFVTDEILSTALRIPKPNLRISVSLEGFVFSMKMWEWCIVNKL